MTQKNERAPLNWANFLVLSITPLMAAILVPYYAMKHGFNAFEWAMFFIFLFFTGLSITAGYHRLWSHKSYKAHFIPRLFYAFWGACSVQNSVFHWASDHRNHHRYTDDLKYDPYCAKRGFIFSHIGWIVRDYSSGSDDFSNIKDLQKDPILRWQHKYYLPLVLLSNIALPMGLGYAYNGNPWGVLLLAGLLRLVLNHHFTFFINSLAHIWGRQPFSDKDTSKDNRFLALFTYGEGYHNFHHRFQNDYRNGIKWWDYDPAKWLIYGLKKLGLASGLKKTSRFQIEEAIADKKYREALAKAQQGNKSEEFRHRLEELYQKVSTSLHDWWKSREEWIHAKKKKSPQTEVAELRKRYLELKRHFKHHRRELDSYALAA